MKIAFKMKNEMVPQIEDSWILVYILHSVCCDIRLSATGKLECAFMRE